MSQIVSPKRSSPFYIKLLGTPTLEWKGQIVSVSRKQARALIFVLGTTLQPISRAHLGFLFWSDKPEFTAKRNLSRLLSYIRKTLPHPEIIQVNKEGIGLNTELVWSDGAHFMDLAEQNELASQEAMVKLYGGLFLSGFVLSHNHEFDLWLGIHQQQFEHLYLSALKNLIQLKFAKQDYATAIEYAQQYLAIDEIAEDIHQLLIQIHAANGDRIAAMRQFENCTLILERELGVGPLPETRAVYNAVRTGETSIKPSQLTKPTWTVLPSLELPLVGREAALRALHEAFQITRTGGLILILGEAGVGKTRLMREFVTQDSHTVLVGNNHATTKALPYRPLVQALRQALSHIQLWAEIPRLWLGELTPLLPELNDHFSGLPRPLEIKPEHAQARLIEALTQVILGLAPQSPPLILCLDDLHWADEATLSWLVSVPSRLADSSVCILGTCRQEEPDSVRSLRRAYRRAGLLTEVGLAGLSQQAINDILNQIPGYEFAREKLVAHLAQTTGGNTFFILETLRVMLESGQMDVPLERQPLPKTVQETILTRLARLSPLARQILEAAAVLSPMLEPALIWETAGRTELEAADGLDELIRRQLLQEGEDGLAFRHDLLRIVVYEALTPWRRQALHRRTAEQLEQHYQNELASSYDMISGRIAIHFEQSGFSGKAIPYYLRAATAAQRVYALAEAYDYTEKGLAQLEKVEDQSAYALQELDLQFLLGAILLDNERAFDPQIEAAFGRAIELSVRLKKPLKQARALIGLSYFNVNQTRLDLGFLQSEQLLALAQELKSSELLVQAHWNLGAISLFRGQFTNARKHLEQAKVYYQREEGTVPTMVFGQPADMVCHGYLAQVLQYLGYSDQALEQIQSAITLAKNTDHLLYLFSSLTLATQMYQQREDAAVTLAAARELLALSDQYKVPIYHLIGNLYTGWALFTQGQRDEGLEHLKQALLILQKIPTIPGTPLCLSVLAEVYIQAGQLEKARTLLDQAWAVMEKMGLSVSEADLCRLRGELLWRQGKPATFIEPNFLRAVQVAQGQQAKWLELRAVMSLARWWQSQGRNEEARQQLARIYDWFTEGFDTVYLKAAKALLEELS